MKESQIQSKIIERHRKSGWFVTKLIQTTTNGIPDLLMIKNGRVVFVEVKAGGNKPTLLQNYVQDEIVKRGVIVYVTDSPDFDLSIECKNHPNQGYYTMPRL